MGDWIGDFLEHGFTVLPKVLPRDLIDEHVAAVAEVFARHGAPHNTRLVEWDKPRQEALHRDLAELESPDSASLRLSMHPEIRERLRELFREEPVRCSVRTALWEFGDRAPHFDTSFVSTTPEDAVCRAWCALDDIHPDSGVFYVVPGTHRTIRTQLLSEILFEKPEFEELLERLYEDREGVQPELHRRVWPFLSAKMAAAIESTERHTFAPGKGDVILFSPNVIHGTMPRRDESLPRKVMISEWRARSARIYFASDHFGPGYDRRYRPGAGRAADLDARWTRQGLIGAPYT